MLQQIIMESVKPAESTKQKLSGSQTDKMPGPGRSQGQKLVSGKQIAGNITCKVKIGKKVDTARRTARQTAIKAKIETGPELSSPPKCTQAAAETQKDRSDRRFQYIQCHSYFHCCRKHHIKV